MPWSELKHQLALAHKTIKSLREELATSDQRADSSYYNGQSSMLLIAQRDNGMGPDTYQERLLDDILDKLETGEEFDE